MSAHTGTPHGLAPPPIMSAEEYALFYTGTRFDSLVLCDRCDCAAGVRDRSIPIYDDEPLWLCEACNDE